MKELKLSTEFLTLAGKVEFAFMLITLGNSAALNFNYIDEGDYDPEHEEEWREALFDLGSKYGINLYQDTSAAGNHVVTAGNTVHTYEPPEPNSILWQMNITCIPGTPIHDVRTKALQLVNLDLCFERTEKLLKKLCFPSTKEDELKLMRENRQKIFAHYDTRLPYFRKDLLVVLKQRQRAVSNINRQFEDSLEEALF